MKESKRAREKSLNIYLCFRVYTATCVLLQLVCEVIRMRVASFVNGGTTTISDHAMIAFDGGERMYAKCFDDVWYLGLNGFV